MLRATDHGPITRIRLARTFAGRALYTVSAYLVDGVLIDSGPPATARELVRWFRDRELRLILNTHYHEDHSGADAALQRAYGVRVLAPADTVERLASFYRLPAYRGVVWGQPRDTVVEPMGEVVETASLRLEVVPTPGHAPDHVCLLERSRGWLFSGDLFIHERVRYLRPIEDVWQHIESLHRVHALEFDTLICAHAGFITNPRAAITRKIAYWEGLAERAQALRRQGRSLRSIRTALLGREGIMTYLSVGDFSKLNLIRGLLSQGGVQSARGG